MGSWEIDSHHVPHRMRHLPAQRQDEGERTCAAAPMHSTGLSAFRRLDETLCAALAEAGMVADTRNLRPMMQIERGEGRDFGGGFANRSEAPAKIMTISPNEPREKKKSAPAPQAPHRNRRSALRLRPPAAVRR